MSPEVWSGTDLGFRIWFMFWDWAGLGGGPGDWKFEAGWRLLFILVCKENFPTPSCAVLGGGGAGWGWGLGLG